MKIETHRAPTALGTGNACRHVMRILGALVLLLVAHAAKGETTMSLVLVSSAFAPDGEIPRRYTCQGEDISPPLSWSGVPEGTKSFVLIVDDPDAPDPKAPRMTWVHWVLYNLPAETRELPQAMGPETVPPGTEEGQNDWKNLGYGGPCPPIGRHRYFHKLYALDTRFPDLGAATKKGVEAAMAGHILARAELVGTYQK